MGPVLGDVPVAEGNEKNGEGGKPPGSLPGDCQQGVGIVLHQHLYFFFLQTYLTPSIDLFFVDTLHSHDDLSGNDEHVPLEDVHGLG